MSDPRRWAILAPGAFTTRAAKTAHGVIAYGADEVAAVIDPDHAGRRVRDVLPYLASDAPIVASTAEALRLAPPPTALLIGIAPAGGELPDAFRAEIATALRAGLEVVSGLHRILARDAAFAELAAAHGARIVDLREPPPSPLFSGAAWDVAPHVCLTVGSDCAVGKMTVALELTAAARAQGVDAGFIPTGQTGIAIAGWGTSIDRVIADFAPGATEQLVLEGARRARDLLVVEGQGGINHPAYAPVTLALLYGAAPDTLVLVHLPSRREVEGYGVPLLGYRELIAIYEGLAATVKPARVAGIALNTRELDDAAARAAIAEAHAQTGLPVDDVVRYGAATFFAAIAPALHGKTAVRRAEPAGA